MLQLDTPVPLVDLDRLDRNLQRMAGYVSQHGLDLRPHVKTHKTPWIAAEQIRLGAAGLTCATPREAEAMSAVTDDVLVAYPPVGALKAKRLASLPSSVDLMTSLDSVDAARTLAEACIASGRTARVLVEADLGMHRVGVQTPGDTVAIAREVAHLDGVEYAGLAFYPGHVREPSAQQDAHLEQVRRDLKAVIAALDDAQLHPGIVSGGSTPTAWRSHEIDGVTEIRPGTYVYNDRTTAAIGACGWDDCALTVLATVVSTAVPGQAVIDAGSKALGREPMRGADGEGFGSLLDRPDVIVKNMSEEHGLLDLSRTSWKPRVGDQVRVVPNHVCIVVHLFDEIVGMRGDQVEREWRVEARGRG